MGATIKIFRRFKKVTYYTVQLDDKEISEYYDFLFKISERLEFRSEFRQLQNFVQDVGEIFGGVSRYFKTEGKAFRFLEPGYIETDNPHHYGLRLYCLPINERIVFLFNGCAKTAQKVQKCPNCSYCFHMANLISQKILEAQQDGFIRINYAGDALEIDNDFDLIF